MICSHSLLVLLIFFFFSSMSYVKKQVVKANVSAMLMLMHLATNSACNSLYCCRRAVTVTMFDISRFMGCFHIRPLCRCRIAETNYGLISYIPRSRPVSVNMCACCWVQKNRSETGEQREAAAYTHLKVFRSMYHGWCSCLWHIPGTTVKY